MAVVFFFNKVDYKMLKMWSAVINIIVEFIRHGTPFFLICISNSHLSTEVTSLFVELDFILLFLSFCTSEFGRYFKLAELFRHVVCIKSFISGNQTAIAYGHSLLTDENFKQVVIISDTHLQELIH